MQKCAKYLIDDIRFGLLDIGSSWDYDDRINDNDEKAFPSVLKDRALGCGVRILRQFQTQTSGKLVLEMLYETSKTADGVYVKIISSKNETVFEYVAENGWYYFNGTKTPIAALEGRTRPKVAIDLDKKTAFFAMDGKTAGVYPLGEFCDAQTLILGTTGKTEVDVAPIKTKLYVDFILNETLLGTQTHIPEPWVVNGNFSMGCFDTEQRKTDYTYIKTTAKAGDKQSAYIPFEKNEGNVAIEGYILMPEGQDGVSFVVKNGKNDIFGVVTENNEFKTLDGAFLRKFTSNVWQHIRFETKEDEVTVKIDGKVSGCFKLCETSFDGIEIKLEPNIDCSLSFADIVCESIIDYPDYCPEPKAVRHPEYDVGMNICNMWREGHHFGWDRITYFKDNVPLIGAYDEGLPEVADWEIKMMVEHGITYQHFCWYCPDPMISAPIKRSRMDNALRDGFMNARYSHLMKFIIMWENAGYLNTNPHEFLEYVWKYWCDYFFTDPRYLVIDNKPVLSLWSFAFVQHWGGEENAMKVLDFMKQDIKRFGFDGMYFIGLNGSTHYRKLSEYVDITYNYHFGSQGFSPIHQINTIDIANSHYDKEGLAPYMQTASVGFNPCAWHGAPSRVPMITPDDFEKVLRHIKKRNDDISDKKWFNKLYMMSTWNEYGEGTYIMPAKLHGFEYLDRIRKIFVDENGKAENLLPDENQKKRISYLRVPDRVMIRRLGYEKDEGPCPNTVVKGLYFDESFDRSIVRCCGNNVEYTGKSLIVTPDNEDLEHYDLLLVDKDKGIFNAEDGTHIRVKLRSIGGYSTFRIPFLTTEDQKWNHKKISPNFYGTDEDGVINYDFFVKKLPTWKGLVTDLRIDNMNRVPFEIISVELMKYEGELKNEISVTSNGSALRFEFAPYEMNSEVIVSLDPGMGVFRRLKLYQEYNDLTSTLILKSLSHEVQYTVGSETAVVDGKITKLRVPMTMRDGLPTLSICELCEHFGYEYSFDNGVFAIKN